MKNHEVLVEFDVDGTLVRFDDKGKLVSHKGHIKAIIEHSRRGHYVRVHSAGGKQWAQHVVNLYGLNEYVDEVCTKARWSYDDQPLGSWAQRVFIKEEGFNHGRSVGSYQEDGGHSQASRSICYSTSSGGGVLSITKT